MHVKIAMYDDSRFAEPSTKRDSDFEFYYDDLCIKDFPTLLPLYCANINEFLESIKDNPDYDAWILWHKLN